MYCQLSCQPFYLLISFEIIEAGEDSFVILVLGGLEIQWSHKYAVRQVPICKIDDDCLSILRKRALSNLKLSPFLIKNIILISMLGENCKAASCRQRKKKTPTNPKPKVTWMFVCLLLRYARNLLFFLEQKLSREGKYFFYDKLVQVCRIFLSLMSNLLHCPLSLIISLRWSSPLQAQEPEQDLVGLDLMLGRL